MENIKSLNTNSKGNPNGSRWKRDLNSFIAAEKGL